MTEARADRRAALLVATIHEIARKGSRGMRVDEVAHRAGVSVALIYHHFGNRTGLMQAALEHIGERAGAYTSRRGNTGREELLAMLLDEIQDDEDVRINSAAWGELRDAAIFDHELRPTLAALAARWSDDIVELVLRAQTDGSISASIEPGQMGAQLPMMVEGVSARWLTGLLSTALARVHLESMVDALLGA